MISFSYCRLAETFLNGGGGKAPVAPTNSKAGEGHIAVIGSPAFSINFLGVSWPAKLFSGGKPV
jgi:hypothetical protein